MLRAWPRSRRRFPGGSPSGDRKRVWQRIWTVSSGLARTGAGARRIRRQSVLRSSAFELVRLIPFQVVLAGFRPDAAIDELLAAIRAADAKATPPASCSSRRQLPPPDRTSRAGPISAGGLARSARPQEPILRLLRARPRLSLRVWLASRCGSARPVALAVPDSRPRVAACSRSPNRYPSAPIRFVLGSRSFGGAHGEASRPSRFAAVIPTTAWVCDS
jgi:hypothetical protein